MCAKVLRQEIVASCTDSGMFAFLADECTDVATREQVSLCVRFVQRGEIKIREEFLGFVLVEGVGGNVRSNGLHRGREVFEVILLPG